MVTIIIICHHGHCSESPFLVNMQAYYLFYEYLIASCGWKSNRLSGINSLSLWGLCSQSVWLKWMKWAHQILTARFRLPYERTWWTHLEEEMHTHNIKEHYLNQIWDETLKFQSWHLSVLDMQAWKDNVLKILKSIELWVRLSVWFQ